MTRTLAMAHVTDEFGETEAEPVIVDADGTRLVLDLDDGRRVDLALEDLAAAFAFRLGVLHAMQGPPPAVARVIDEMCSHATAAKNDHNPGSVRAVPVEAVEHWARRLAGEYGQQLLVDADDGQHEFRRVA